MLKRLREWAQARLDDAVMRHVREFAQETAHSIDYQRLALEASCLQEFKRELAQTLQKEMAYDLAENVAEHIDAGDVASHLTHSISAEDVASCMDAEDVAGYVDVDLDDIATRVAEEIDVSECVDYDKLAETLVSKLKEAWA